MKTTLVLDEQIARFQNLISKKFLIRLRVGRFFLALSKVIDRLLSFVAKDKQESFIEKIRVFAKRIDQLIKNKLYTNAELTLETLVQYRDLLVYSDIHDSSAVNVSHAIIQIEFDWIYTMYKINLTEFNIKKATYDSINAFLDSADSRHLNNCTIVMLKKMLIDLKEKRNIYASNSFDLTKLLMLHYTVVNDPSKAFLNSGLNNDDDFIRNATNLGQFTQSLAELQAKALHVKELKNMMDVASAQKKKRRSSVKKAPKKTADKTTKKAVAKK